MESKLDIAKRLQRRPNWKELEAEKDAKIKQYREEGFTRSEAADKAWQDMAEKYPPVELFPTIEDSGEHSSQTAASSEAPQFGNDGEFIAGALWVYSNLSRPVNQLDAPDDGAWALLVWARAFPNDFFKSIMPRVLELQAKFSISKDAEAEGEIEDCEGVESILAVGEEEGFPA